MRADSAIFLVEPKHIPVCWKLPFKRVLSIVTGLDCSRLKTVSMGLSKKIRRR
jgi:hypothetical protein